MSERAVSRGSPDGIGRSGDDEGWATGDFGDPSTRIVEDEVMRARQIAAVQLKRRGSRDTRSPLTEETPGGAGGEGAAPPVFIPAPPSPPTLRAISIAGSEIFPELLDTFDNPLSAEVVDANNMVAASDDNMFQRVVITGAHELTDEHQSVCAQLHSCIKLRKKYVYNKPQEYWGGLDKSSFKMPHNKSRGASSASGAKRKSKGPRLPPAAGMSTARESEPLPATAEGSTAPPVDLRRSMTPLELVGSIDGKSSDGDNTPTSTSPGRATAAKEKFFKVKKFRPEPPFRPFEGEIPSASQHTFEMVDGVVHVYEVDDSGNKIRSVHEAPSFSEYYRDYREVVRVSHAAAVNSFAFRRLELLEARFNLHCLLNSDREMAQQKSVPHRDFYNVRKVDTHVHHSACMNQKHMLRFIKHKLKRCPDEVVIFRGGRFMTLAEVFDSLSLTAFDLSINTLDMHADNNTFHRFDRFNLKYNPCGQSRLREIFLKTDNLLGGKYLAEVTQEVFEDLESYKYQLAEYRISIYGRYRAEWDKLARWVYVHRLASPNVRWLIQVPRLYEIYKKTGEVNNFQEMIDNMFLPLFQVSIDPTVNPALHYFLNLVVGFDCVDDESKHERHRDAPELPIPAKWTTPHNPPYFYWVYYLHTNIKTLNKLRASKGMSTFSFRPHAGEAGEIDHLAATFLTSESVNHGIQMRRQPALQYLYYLTQIGLAMSPLSNNKLFIDYHRNPFFTYFARGLNVSLSTDDPLLLHLTKEPLVEEYCVAAQVWKMTDTDKCEIARNSVLQSGFEHPYKAHYIGGNYNLPGVAGNDINLTNVPNIRLLFRWEALQAERNLIHKGAAMGKPHTLASPLPAGLRSDATKGGSPLRTKSKVDDDVLSLEPPALHTGLGDKS